MLNSILAGAFIGLGNLMYLLIDNKIIASVIFSCGLLGVRLYKLFLFTGQAQYILTRTHKLSFYFKVLIGNVIGILIVRFCLLPPSLDLNSVVAAKNNLDAITIFAGAVGCGILMSLATYQDTPLWISTLCVSAFLLSGFNHCIANAFYLFDGINIFNWCLTIIGNALGGALFTKNFLSSIEKWDEQ